MNRHQITKDELLDRLSAGETSFRAIELDDGTDLSTTDFSGCDFTGSFLTDVSFRDSILRQAILHDCNLKCSDFRGADLIGASFRGSSIEGIFLRLATVDPTALIGARFQSTTLDCSSAIEFLKNARSEP